MSGDSIRTIRSSSPFDEIRHVSESGIEYWYARELQNVLDYATWENFEEVIGKAQTACIEGAEELANHFRERTKMIATGKGATRGIRDYILSRHASFLIAMNGNSSKKVIAEAQIYFARQTHRQEEADRLTDEQKRILLRNRVKDVNTILNEAAPESGVENFGKFQNAGYRGLYGGYAVGDLKRKKGVPPKDELLDRMGREELASNEFRITQTEKKLRAERILGEEDATEAHRQVGKKVRKAIMDIGGTMPEELPAEVHIKAIEKKTENIPLAKRLKSSAQPSPPARLSRPVVTPMRPDDKWSTNSRVVVVGVTHNNINQDGSGFQYFENLEAAREAFHDLDIFREGPRFTQAMGNPRQDVMRFETWIAFEIYSE